MAELTGDPVFTCVGDAPEAIVGDVVVTLNTNLNSKKVGDDVEALLLVGNPATPQLGVNAFLGKLAGNNAVRFAGIPLASVGANASRLFRVTNLRADASLPQLFGNDITARIEIQQTPVALAVANAQQIIIARRAAPVNPSFGTAVAGNGVAQLPVTYQELLPNTFRTRILPGQNPGTLPIAFTSESGYANTNVLGDKVGIADTGFRLQLTLRSLPAGSRVQAPVTVQTGTARADLVTQDARGAGVGLVTGTNQDLDIVDGQATATYEITATNPAALETLSFNLLFPNFTAASVNTLKTNFVASCGPVATGLPANGVLPVPRCGDPLAPAAPISGVLLGANFVAQGAGLDRSPDGTVRRAPTGNRTVSLQVSMSCDAGAECPEPIIRGNFSQGTSFTGGCDASDGGGTCSGAGEDVVIEYPAMEPGQQVTAVLAAELRDDAPNASLVQFNASASTGISVAYGEIEQCFNGVSGFPQPPGQGVSGTLTVYACGPWTLTSSVPWMTFNPSSGTGNVEVQYTVLPNTTGAARTGTVTLPGATPITVQQLPPGSGLRFVPIAPCRLLETRPLYAGTTWTGVYGPPRINANQTRTLPIAGGGRCGIPASAKAFVLNVTVDTVEENTGPVDTVTVFPTGTTRPPFRTISTTTGGYIANNAIVQAGINGAVDIFSSNNAHVLVDINGYFTDDAGAQGLLYYPYGPCRAVDTRDVYNTLPAPYGHQRMQAQETRTFRLPGSPGCAGLPVSSAYSLQMTLAPGLETNGGAVAYVTAWPTGQSQPIISNMNALFGYAVANSGIVPSSSNGSINVFTFDATNVILDVNGYFAPDDGTGRGLFYFPVSQCRAVNTQDLTLFGAYGPPQITPAADRVIPIAGSGRCQGLPSTAKAWALNATATPNGVGLPFLSMWPSEAGWPGVSQLNAFQGQTVSNSGIVPAGPNGAIQVKVNATTHVAIEVAGYFSR
jgi:hypothetical protein